MVTPFSSINSISFARTRPSCTKNCRRSCKVTWVLRVCKRESN